MPHSEHPCLEVCETFSKRTRRKDEVSRVTGTKAESHKTQNGMCVRTMAGGWLGTLERWEVVRLEARLGAQRALSCAMKDWAMRIALRSPKSQKKKKKQDPCSFLGAVKAAKRCSTCVHSPSDANFSPATADRKGSEEGGRGNKGGRTKSIEALFLITAWSTS